MVALAFISTFILCFFILAIIETTILNNDEQQIGFVIIAMLGFVIMCVWVLYAR